MNSAARNCPGKDDLNLCPGHATRTFIGYLRQQGPNWLPFDKSGRPVTGEFDRQETAAYAIYRANQQRVINQHKAKGKRRVESIVNKLLEADDVNPEDYLKQVPPRLNREEVLQKIFDETAWCLDDPKEHRKFVLWLKRNAHLFPDTVKAMTVAMKNHTWCTDNEDDMDEFLLQLGFPRPDNSCPRCDGSGEEPGAPFDEDGDGNVLRPVCDRCHGTGTLPVQGQRTFR